MVKSPRSPVAGRRSPSAGVLRSVPVIAALAAVFAAALVGGGTSPAVGQPAFPEILERLNQVNPGLLTFIVEQTAQVRVLRLLRWELRATVYAARPARYRVVVHNMPALLRGLGNVFAGVSSVEQLLADYRITSVRRDGGARLVVEVAGARPEVNPPAGVAVIDGERWTVEELRLRYNWGEVHARYTYALFEGYLLPVAARVVVFGIPAEADLTYSNYRLNAPLPPGTFDAEERPTRP